MSRLRMKLIEILKHVPPLDLDPEKEDELVEKLVQAISKSNLELPAILWGTGYVPMSTILSQTALLPLAPFLEMLGIRGYEYTAFFSKKRNVQRLLERLEELKKEKE